MFLLNLINIKELQSKYYISITNSFFYTLILVIIIVIGNVTFNK
jgi:hypothetical protein